MGITSSLQITIAVYNGYCVEVVKIMKCSLCVRKFSFCGNFELYAEYHELSHNQRRREKVLVLITVLQNSEIKLNDGRFISYCTDDFGNIIKQKYDVNSLIFDKSLEWIKSNVNCKWSFKIHHLGGTNSFFIMFDFADKNIATLFKLLGPCE